MSIDFFKFPSTPHLALMPGVDVRGDKVMTEEEREEFLGHELVVEEKVDGANLGISFGDEGEIRVQNRGAYLLRPFLGQWNKLEEWLDARADLFFDFLGDRYILFGEWCYARHSVFYDCLPDWFLAFDVFDRVERRFLSTDRRELMFEGMRLERTPVLGRGRFTFGEIQGFFAESCFAEGLSEGLYLRVDEGDWLRERAKLVRSCFVQAIGEHWTRAGIEPNRICFEGRD